MRFRDTTRRFMSSNAMVRGELVWRGSELSAKYLPSNDYPESVKSPAG